MHDRFYLQSPGSDSGTAQQDDQVPAAYETIVRTFTTDDEAWGRLAAWYKTKTNYEKARETYGRYADKNEGLGQVGYSYREQQNWPLAIQTYQQLLGQDVEHQVKWKPELLGGLSRQPGSKVGRSDRGLRRTGPRRSSKRRSLAAGGGKHYSPRRRTTQGSDPETTASAKTSPKTTNRWPPVTAKPNNQTKRSRYTGKCRPTNHRHPGRRCKSPAHALEEAGQAETAIPAFPAGLQEVPQRQHHASVAHAHCTLKYKISVTLGGANEE